MAKYAGAEWLKMHVDNMSPFGERVANILGYAYKGIYHLDTASLTNKSVAWSHARNIVVSLRGGISTYDFDVLMRLLTACCKECVRLEIAPSNFTHLKLIFHARERKPGFMMSHHPDVAEMMNADTYEVTEGK